MATEKFTNKPQQSFVSGGDRVASHALYIATVKATADNERMGRIRVFVNAFDGDQNDPKTWITVRYLTPFYGVTHLNLQCQAQMIGARHKNHMACGCRHQTQAQDVL